MSTATLDRIVGQCDSYRDRNYAIKHADPELWLMRATPGETGLKTIGRLDYRVATKATIPDKKNVTATAVLNWRLDHFLARELIKTPNDPDVCKNIVLIVRRGEQEWSGLLHHWDVETRGGIHYFTTTWNSDIQFLQFMLGPPNPALPIPIFQFPRDLPLFFPAKYAVSLLILMNLIRIEGHPWTLPDDPFDISTWDSLLDWSSWQVRIKCNPLPLDDSSLWTFIATRMNTIDSVIADPLDDGQLVVTWRRVMTDWGENVEGLIGGDNVANGTLVFEIVDKSGYYAEGGTLLTQNMFTGLVRTIVVYAEGDINDDLTVVTDTEETYPDEYYQAGFFSTLPATPWIVLRDSPWSGFDSKLTWSPATAVSVVVGGDNPTADAIEKLIIETAGNLLGYFLLGGFDSLGDIADSVIQPFINGTVLAWDEWKNIGRVSELGWAHLMEIYQAGAEQNSFSFTAAVTLRGGFEATKSETSHAISIPNAHWLDIGRNCSIGDRIGSTQYGVTKSGIDVIWINQIEETDMAWDHTAGQPMSVGVKIGQNKAGMTIGEREARMVKKALDKINDIGFHFIS